MTHDELLTRLWEKRNSLCDNLDVHFALSAVVELHKPMLWKNLGNDTDGYKCQVCEGKSYPCSTIEAIEKGLE